MDRYYIEAFLAAHSEDIRGRALEVDDASYCRQVRDGIVQQDVLDIRADNPGRRSSATFRFLASYRRKRLTVWS